VKNITLMIAAALVLSQTGCSMCCGPFDYDYPSFGGKHLRADRSHGRVGSVLSDPMTTLNGPSADSNLAAPPEPDVRSSDDENLYDESLDDSKPTELEGIEPLRDNDTLQSPDKKDSDESTASTRWRPRPLR